MSRDSKAVYYDAGSIDTQDIIKAKLTPEEYRGYLKGSALKYLCRASFKGTEERDIEKASNFTIWLVEENK